MQIKVPGTILCSLQRLKKLAVLVASEDVEQRELFNIADENAKLHGYSRKKKMWLVLTKLFSNFTYECYISMNKITRYWEYTKCPTSDKWLKILCHITSL